jgi:hypothetical protein
MNASSLLGPANGPGPVRTYESRRRSFPPLRTLAGARRLFAENPARRPRIPALMARAAEIAPRLIWVSRLCLDDRVLCVEHVEDLRHTPRTREEFRRVLAAAARHRRVVVTLTRTPRDGAILRWLRSWADVYALN